MSVQTLSEHMLEEWFDRHGIEWRRIRVARNPGNRRPDYALRAAGKRCIIEVKELTQNDEDKRLVENARSGIVEARWVAPGKRLRPAIRSGEGQLRKFSARGFPTIICVFDTTASFHDTDFHVRAAMYGDETLRLIIPEGSDTAHFVGSGPGRNAMLRRDERNTISAVALLRHPSGSDPVIDLYHNPFAAIPIDPTLAAPFVRHQINGPGNRPEREGHTWFDIRDDPAYRDFLDDPDAAIEKAINEILGSGRGPSLTC
jgi:hypothetical protein